MSSIFPEIKKHILVYMLFLKNCLMSQMEYRANFLINICVEATFLTVKVLYAYVVYNVGVSINGIPPNGVLLFIGTYLIMSGIFTCLFMENFYGVAGQIRSGSLDVLIVKPVSLQFILTLRHANFALPIPNILAGVAMLAVACKKLGILFTIPNFLGYIGIIFAGVVMTYTIFLFPHLLSFWFLRTGSLVEICDKGWDFNNMPMNIYNKWLQRIGTFAFPIFVIVNFPAKFLLNDLNTLQLVWTFIAPVLFFVLLRLVWNIAIKNYSSASS